MKEHGNFFVRIEKNIIITRIEGLFNEFAVKSYNKMEKEAISTFNGEKFCMLVEAMDFEGATPEAYKINNDFNEKYINKDLTAKAVISNHMVHLQISLKQQPAFKKQNIKYFDNTEDGFKWLRQFEKES